MAADGEVPPDTETSTDCNVASLLLDVLPPLLVSAELVAAPLLVALLLLLPPTPSLLFASFGFGQL